MEHLQCLNTEVYADLMKKISPEKSAFVAIARLEVIEKLTYSACMAEILPKIQVKSQLKSQV